jgi:hypothetical protein
MTFMQARWRLQLLAELGIGTLVREVKQAEDAGVRKLREATSGRSR